MCKPTDKQNVGHQPLSSYLCSDYTKNMGVFEKQFQWLSQWDRQEMVLTVTGFVEKKTTVEKDYY